MRTLQRVGLCFRFRALIATGLIAVQLPVAFAITINIEYTDEGDPVPHDENPAWDPAGVILKAHFQTAKSIWEALIPGEGEYSFDFHWDDDLDANVLGQYTPGIDEFIEINPIQPWFADPTLGENEEFGPGTQTLFSGLSPFNQSTFFPGTAPPGALEVGYRGAGLANGTLVNGVPVNTVSASGQTIPGPGGNPTQVDASNGFDLLSTIVHEIGHALGINGEEPGEFNIFPQHVGGLTDVLVKEDEGGGHFAGGGTVPFLMCDGCGDIGVRRFATATDILVIAEDQGITDVHLARVGRSSLGDWSNTNAWIGADVPDATQDVYVAQGGAVLLDVDANVKNLTISNGSSVDAQTLDLTSASDINFDGGSLAVGIGGSITANKIDGDPASLTTTAFSLVRFNEFTRGTSFTTSVTFNGSVGIGQGIPPDNPITFNPSTLANWNIAQNLTVGDQRAAKLVIDNGTWNVSGNLTIQGKRDGIVTHGSTVTIESTGAINVTGVVDINTNGELEYKNNAAVLNATYVIRGGDTFIDDPPGPEPPSLKHTPGSRMTLYGSVSTGTATIDIEGGTGDGGLGGVLTFKGDSRALDAQVWTRPGIGGISLHLSHPTVIAGTGGRVRFEDSSYASTAHFRNDGVNDHGASGSGGATYFLENSYASDAVFDNYGSPMTGYTGAVPAPGGRTEFFDDSSAWTADFNNHPGLGMGALGAGITVFHGSSTADEGTFINKGGVPGLPYGGATEFHDQATADDATFTNEPSGAGVAQSPGTAGNTRFYGNSNAGTATFRNKVGGGTTVFNDSSSAGDAQFFIEDGGAPGIFGGNVVFTGNSKGGTSEIIVRPQSFAATVQFGLPGNLTHAPDAEDADIILENGSNAGLQFNNSATMGNANIDIGSQGGLNVRELATAGNATIRLRPGSQASFTGINNPGSFPTVSGGEAEFNIDGGSVSGGNGGALFFSSLSTAGNSTINVNGGTVSGAGGAQVHFGSGANAGTATVIAGSGVAGAGGGGINLGGGTIASNARFTVGAGGFVSLPSGGPIEVGSIEGAGTIQLGHNELRAGALNTSTTISGPIIGFATNPRLTKIGTGTLTLTGANTYIGLTKVDGGTLVINGSTPGSVEVNDGAALKGIGTIGGAVTVNSGGTLAPGNSTGLISIGSLAMTPGGILDFELSENTYDRIVASGNAALAGILNVSLFGSFMPAAGNAFNILDWATNTGAFNTLNLPALSAGLSWDTSQLYTSGVLSVSAGLAGDFNNDGNVDTADYAAWRKGVGVASTPANYNLWRANFGRTSGGGSGATAGGSAFAVANLPSSAVPEPNPLLLLAIAVVLAIPRDRVVAKNRC